MLSIPFVNFVRSLFPTLSSSLPHVLFILYEYSWYLFVAQSKTYQRRPKGNKYFLICSIHLKMYCGKKKIHHSKGVAFEKHIVFLCFVFLVMMAGMHWFTCLRKEKKKSWFLAKRVAVVAEKKNVSLKANWLLAYDMARAAGEPCFQNSKTKFVYLFSVILKSLFYNKLQSLMSSTSLTIHFFSHLLMLKKSHLFVLLFWFCLFVCFLSWKKLLPIVL